MLETILYFISIGVDNYFLLFIRLTGDPLYGYILGISCSAPLSFLLLLIVNKIRKKIFYYMIVYKVGEEYIKMHNILKLKAIESKTTNR